VAGFTKVARDEHRHVAFGARFLRDMVRRDPGQAETIRRTLALVAPAADGVLRPKWFEGADDEPLLYGVSVSETRAFALKALERRLTAIGLAAAAGPAPPGPETPGRAAAA
jgi:ribonucleoside-diphosphate reductase beta chain